MYGVGLVVDLVEDILALVSASGNSFAVATDCFGLSLVADIALGRAENETLADPSKLAFGIGAGDHLLLQGGRSELQAGRERDLRCGCGVQQRGVAVGEGMGVRKSHHPEPYEQLLPGRRVPVIAMRIQLPIASAQVP